MDSLITKRISKLGKILVSIITITILIGSVYLVDRNIILQNEGHVFKSYNISWNINPIFRWENKSNYQEVFFERNWDKNNFFSKNISENDLEMFSLVSIDLFILKD